jgi:Fic family protein
MEPIISAPDAEIMARFIHDLPDWPDFEWKGGTLATQLAAVRHRQGRLIGEMRTLGFPLRQEAILATLTQDVVKSSEIEGEILDKAQVRSSIARRLGIAAGALPPADRIVEGVVEMMLDATQKFVGPLTEDRLFGWHSALFPTGRSGINRIVVGAWRKGPMQVVSGDYGRERVHFEAPAAERLDREMQAFLDWYNGDNSADPVLRAAVAHLWFVTIHPFDDGNGRIARAIADMSLARSEDSAQRFYSMSAQIRIERKTYYSILETTQRAENLDITPWLEWFLRCLGRAFEETEGTLSEVFRKDEFWKRHTAVPLNSRQRDMVNRLLDGFVGKLTSSKWALIQKCSPDSALRDVTDLVERGMLVKEAPGGRSTSYRLSD